MQNILNTLGWNTPGTYQRWVEQGMDFPRPWHRPTDDALVSWMQGLQGRFPNRKLVPFARRVDCDDVACFDLDDGRISIIHDFCEPPFEQTASYSSFTEWLTLVICDFIEFDPSDTDSLAQI